MIHFQFPSLFARIRTRASFRRISDKVAWKIVIALMFPASLMPMASSVVRVASPLFRDAFQLTTESLAWLSMSFTIPFMVLMPVYCRLSEMVGRRRLILAGTALFLVGALTSMLSPNFPVLMLGQGIQGLGVAGMTPLGMAYISTIFEKHERGQALGTWSSVGPTTASLGPFLAGILIFVWNWRVAFVLSLVAGLLALAAVAKGIPPGYSHVQPEMWRRFDWLGVALLACAVVSFFGYLSSQPLTGVASLRDWRLGLLALAFLALLIGRELTARNPFIELGLYRFRLFRLASACAAVRMMTMGATGLLIPLYLVDLYAVEGIAIGAMLMINPLAMSLMVRYGGQIADRWGSRRPLTIGFSMQLAILLALFYLPADASLWLLGCVLAAHGLGVGTMLAALHRIAMLDADPSKSSIAAGMYSLTRFVGVAIGTSVAGVLYQQFRDTGSAPLEAYKYTFLCFTAAAAVGLLLALLMNEGRSDAKPQGPPAQGRAHA